MYDSLTAINALWTMNKRSMHNRPNDPSDPYDNKWRNPKPGDYIYDEDDWGYIGTKIAHAVLQQGQGGIAISPRSRKKSGLVPAGGYGKFRGLPHKVAVCELAGQFGKSPVFFADILMPNFLHIHNRIFGNNFSGLFPVSASLFVVLSELGLPQASSSVNPPGLYMEGCQPRPNDRNKGGSILPVVVPAWGQAAAFDIFSIMNAECKNKVHKQTIFGDVCEAMAQLFFWLDFDDKKYHRFDYFSSLIDPWLNRTLTGAEAPLDVGIGIKIIYGLDNGRT